MHRLLVDSPLLKADEPVLPSEAAHHLRVVRPRAGEEVELFDGKGFTRRFSWTGSGLKATGALVGSACPATSLTLFACVTKGSRWDWTIEKATELGVTRIVPVISARTIVRIPADERAAKRERWQRIAEDAARQSDATWLPEIREAMDFADSLPLVRATTCFVGALSTPPPEPILTALDHHRQARNLATYVGPEGDFTPEELAALVKIGVPVSFGPTVLRAETAAIFALSVLAAARGV